MAFSTNTKATSLAAGSTDGSSVEDQFSTSVANLTFSELNSTSTKSAIQEVDFAEETSNFAKMQVLAKAGVFAMAQCNKHMRSNLLN